MYHSPIDYPWGSEVARHFQRAQDLQGLLNMTMQSKVVLLRSAFASQTAPNSTEVSALYLWNATLPYFCVNK